MFVCVAVFPSIMDYSQMLDIPIDMDWISTQGPAPQALKLTQDISTEYVEYK